MSEPSTTRLFCRDCKTEIFRKSPARGRIPTQCADCRTLDTRRRAREQHERKKSGYVLPTTFVCVDCDGEFPRPRTSGTIPVRCQPCWQVNETNRTRQRCDQQMAELRRVFEVEGRWTKCETCGLDIRCATRKGRASRWCDPCRNARRRERDKVARPWARVGKCIECGGRTSRETGDTRRDLCPKCFAAARDGKGQWITKVSPERRADIIKYGPSATRTRGPWGDRFTALEIYRRDRWRCQVCLKRVDETLRSPHRGSASLDHIIPQSQDGIDVRANVRLAHRSCNSSRNNRGGNEQLALLG